MIPADLTPTILRGHALDVLRQLPENSIQCVVTGPPYWGQRSYGTEAQVWDAANLRTLCRACHLAKTNARRRWGDSTLAERVLYERNHPEAHPRLEAFL